MSQEVRQLGLIDEATRLARGRFVRPDMERRFRLLSLTDDRTAAWWVVLVIGLLFPAYIVTDYVLFGVSAEFEGLLALRVAFMAASLALLVPIRRCTSPVALDRMLLAWAVAFIACFLATAATRPSGSVGLVVTYLPVLLFAYAALPLPHVARVALAWGTCVGFICIRWLVAHDIDPTGWNAVLIGSVATHALGTMISLRWHATARRLVAQGWRTEGLRAAADSAAGLREFRMRFDDWPDAANGASTVFGIVHRDDVMRLERALFETRTSGTDFRVDFRVATALGDRWVRAAGLRIESPTHDDTLAGLYWDIHDRRIAEERAEFWQDRLEATLERMRMVVWERDAADGTRRALGPQAELFGCVPDSVGAADALLHPDDRDADAALFEHAQRTGTDYANEFRLVRADGSVRWMHSQARPIVDAAGRVTGMSGIAFDVSERKALEADIDALRRRLEETLEAAHMFSWDWNLRTGERTTFGPAAAVLGPDLNEFGGVLALIHPDDRPGVDAGIAASVASGTTHELEFRLRAADGQWRWIYSRGTPVIGADGKTERFVGISIDVDARKRAEQRVADLSDRLQLAVCAARLNPWSVNLRTRQIEPGPLDEDLYGRRILSDACMREIVPPSDWQELERLPALAATSIDGSHAVEFRVHHKDLGLRWIACHGRLVRGDDGLPLRLDGVSFDVTARKIAEQSLESSSTRLEQALQAGRMTLWTWAPGAGFRASYGGAVELFGCDQATSREFFAMIHPDDRDGVAQRFLDALENGEPYLDEYRLARAGGAVAWVQSQARVDVDEQSGIRTMAGVTVDVTERKLAELDLQWTRMRLTRALDAARMLCWEWDLRTRTRRSVGNDMQLLGSVPHTVDESRALIHPDDLPQYDEAVARAIAQRGTYRSEFRVLHPDGPRWVLSVGEVACDAHGEPVTLAGVAMDVTERRHVEAMLADSRRWRDLAVEAGELNIWEVDPATGVRRGGAYDARIFGCSPDSFTTFRAMILAEDAQRVEDAWRRCVTHAEAIAVEFRIRRADDGSVRWLSSHGKLVRDETTGAARVVGVTGDITVRKTGELELRNALQAARAASEAKSAFLATVSHELRTPLSAVVGFTELLARTTLDPVQASHVTLLEGSARQLLALISDVLDFSRIEAGEMPIETQPFVPEACLTACLAQFEAQAAAKGLGLTLATRGDTARRVLGDATRMQQIVANLVSNAVKFTATGGIHCELDVADDCGRARLAIRVHDTGIGFGVNARDRLFQPFAQGDASTTRRFGGSGLGLSICKRLARLMDGDVHVTESTGSGSVVEVVLRLPWAGVSEEDQSMTTREEPTPNAPLRIRALIAEDNPVNQLLLQLQLGTLGVDADVTASGEDAVALVARGDYDLVLMDIEMPDVDGMEATRRIRALGLARAPVIVAVTAHVLADSRARFLAAGMDDYLRKPVSIDDLRALLQRRVEGASAIAT